MADVAWMARPDFPFPQIATGDLDIPVVGQLPAAEPSVRRRFRAGSAEDDRFRGSVPGWKHLEARVGTRAGKPAPSPHIRPGRYQTRRLSARGSTGRPGENEEHCDLLASRASCSDIVLNHHLRLRGTRWRRF